MKTAKRGRPTVYTEELADEICERLAAGESLCEICADPRMPGDATVSDWSAQDSEARPGFVGRYARARQRGFERLADELIAISDASYVGPDGFVDNAAVQQARLKSDNRKWLLSKMLPRQFGDRVTQEITGSAEAPLVTMIQLVPVAPVARLLKSDGETAQVAEAAAVPLRVVPSR